MERGVKKGGGLLSGLRIVNNQIKSKVVIVLKQKD